MKPVIIIVITFVFSIVFSSTIPDVDAKTWKVHVLDMPKQWESHFGDIYHESASYWEKRYPGTYFVEESNREKSDFVVQWSSQFQGTKLGYYTSSSNNDFGRPFIAITMGFMDDESVSFQDRKFNLVDAEYSKLITIHEIGHAIGYGHSDDRDDIMYPSIYNYDDWLKTKQLGSLENNRLSFEYEISPRPLGNIITQYNSKSITIQEEANSRVEEVKENIYSKQDLLYSKEYQSPEAQEELNKAWDSLGEAKNYLEQAEWTQKEGEHHLKSSNYEEAYFKYLHSTGIAKKAFDPIIEINNIVESAEKLESEYQTIKVKSVPEQKEEKKQTCFLIWCW